MIFVIDEEPITIKVQTLICVVSTDIFSLPFSNHRCIVNHYLTISFTSTIPLLVIYHITNNNAHWRQFRAPLITIVPTKVAILVHLHAINQNYTPGIGKQLPEIFLHLIPV